MVIGVALEKYIRCGNPCGCIVQFNIMMPFHSTPFVSLKKN
jgi:hypothetical protein